MPVEPNPCDTPELLNVDKDDPDPIVQYLVVKESLNMSAGKISTQCGHGVMYFMIRYMGYWANDEEIAKACDKEPEELARFELAKKWMDASHRKVTLAASDSEFERVKRELHCFLVKDAGLTEVVNGSETVLCLWPMRKSQRPGFLKRMRAL